VDAVRCAVDMQRGTAERNVGVPTDKRIELRIGINVGDIVIDGDDILGDGVNIAARLEGLAEPGGVLVSRAVRDQVRDRLELARMFQPQTSKKTSTIANRTIGAGWPWVSVLEGCRGRNLHWTRHDRSWHFCD